MAIGFRSGHMRETAGYRTRRPTGGSEWLLIVTISGAGVHRYGSTQAILPAGTAILYEPVVAQDYGATARGWELIWTHFLSDGRLDRLLDWPQVSGGARILELGSQADAVIRTLEELVRWQAGGAADRHEFAANALERALLWCNRANPAGPLAGRDPRVEAGIAHITANLTEDLSVDAIARAAGLSRSRFAHLFRATVGRSVPAYVEARRMERAEDLLRMTNRPIREIASLVGYRDPLYFSKRFRLRTGSSPRAWRTRYRLRKTTTLRPAHE